MLHQVYLYNKIYFGYFYMTKIKVEEKTLFKCKNQKAKYIDNKDNNSQSYG